MIYKYAGELNCLPSFFDDKKGKDMASIIMGNMMTKRKSISSL
jgi:hypothetical protein